MKVKDDDFEEIGGPKWKEEKWTSLATSVTKEEDGYAGAV